MAINYMKVMIIFKVYSCYICCEDYTRREVFNGKVPKQKQILQISIVIKMKSISM